MSLYNDMDATHHLTSDTFDGFIEDSRPTNELPKSCGQKFEWFMGRGDVVRVLVCHGLRAMEAVAVGRLVHAQIT